MNPPSVRLVLVEPTHPGNIGAVARAMANMGLQRLTLVKPLDFPSAAATARAAGADEILHRAEVTDDLDAAIADCDLVLATSARARSIAWPELQPRAAMQKIAGGGHRHAAVLFGRESRGLTNAELERCHYLVRIPSVDAFPSLNIAAAAIVLCYELRLAMLDEVPAAAAGDAMATAEEMRHFYGHLQRLLKLVEFAEEDDELLHRKMTRLFNRARPFAREVRMLRGVFSAVEKRVLLTPP